MSTKKDKHNQKDNYYMKLAFKLAEDNYGLTGENPSVGCVIVKNNEVISCLIQLIVLLLDLLRVGSLESIYARLI